MSVLLSARKLIQRELKFGYHQSRKGRASFSRSSMTRKVLRQTLPLFSRGLIVFLPLLFAVRAEALDPNKGLNEFGHQSWLTENGLPQNTVQAITQTRDGYLWIATQEGLARFNGTGFFVFDKENTPQLKSNDIRALLEDRQGALWISTSYGLVRMQGGTFTSFTTADGLPDNSVGPGVEDPDGSIWIATAAGLVRYLNGSFVANTAHADVAGPNIQALFQGADGVLWVGTANGVTSLKGDQVVNSKPISPWIQVEMFPH